MDNRRVMLPPFPCISSVKALISQHIINIYLSVDLNISPSIPLLLTYVNEGGAIHHAWPKSIPEGMLYCLSRKIKHGHQVEQIDA